MNWVIYRKEEGKQPPQMFLFQLMSQFYDLYKLGLLLAQPYIVMSHPQLDLVVRVGEPAATNPMTGI